MYSPSFPSGIVLKARQTPSSSTSIPQFGNDPLPTSTTFVFGPASSSDTTSTPLSTSSSTTGDALPSSSPSPSSFTSFTSTSLLPPPPSSSSSISISTAQSVALSTTFVTSTSSLISTSTLSFTSTFSSSVSSSSSLITSEQLQFTNAPLLSDPIPATTFVVSADTSPSSTSASTTNSGPSLPVEAVSSKGFWSNKSAVAGTFTAVTVAVLALAAGLYLFMRKKRRSYRYGDEIYSEKYPEPELLNGSRPPSSNNSPSDFSHAPMDVYASREPEYYPHPDPFFSSSPVYPAGGSLPEITYSYAKDVNNQYPYYGDEGRIAAPAAATNSTPNLTVSNPFEPQTSSNPFEGPSAAGRTGMPQVTYREPAARDSAYQPSIDSFYGTPTSNSNAAQAL